MTTMKVLWLSMNPGLYGVKSGNDTYNGGGWIGALERVLQDTNIQLAIAFITDSPLKQVQRNNITYYPIYIHSSKWEKIKFYYGGYKRVDNLKVLEGIHNIISHVSPDIIHLFGIENQLSTVIGNVEVPIITHLQGLLGPYSSTYWPSGFNVYSIKKHFSWREHILRNGMCFMSEYTRIRGTYESTLFKKLKYAMGRTAWDHHMTALLAPQAKYFHVDEVLRPCFYDISGTWNYRNHQLCIFSTISETPYKGLDLVLKTARILKDQGIEFKWRIAGISSQSRMTRIFEKELDIKGKEVGIDYLGILTAEQLCENLLNSTIYVHPSYIDNSPNSLCEAQLIGLPCISTNVGGTSSLINHLDTGILVPANAPYDLAYYIKELGINDELRCHISKQGAEAAKIRHNKENILNQLLNAYQTVIKNRLT